MPQPDNSHECLKVIRKISSELTSTLGFGEVLRYIARTTAETMEVKGCALRLVNKKTNELLLASSWGLSEEYLAKGPLHADHSLSACMEGETVHIPDVANDPRIEYPENARSAGIVSMLSVPMTSRNEIVGALRLYAATPRNFSEEEIEFVRTLADLGTLAIEHARLYSNLEKDHKSLIENFHHWFESSVYGNA
ncbi:MAG: GAF domain-containing protein [bacterium]|nr:GAF domain-containing protein [bacterium]